MKLIASLPPVLVLLIATLFEVGGDSLIRVAIYNHSGLARLGLLLVGGALLFFYGSFLNLAPFDFGQLAGLYIAVLFIVWQVINLVAFRTLPSLPMVVGGSMIVVGGLLVTFWKSR
jgi:small multidrug resistance family-3 protein